MKILCRKLWVFLILLILLITLFNAIYSFQWIYLFGIAALKSIFFKQFAKERDRDERQYMQRELHNTLSAVIFSFSSFCSAKKRKTILLGSTHLLFICITKETHAFEIHSAFTTFLILLPPLAPPADATTADANQQQSNANEDSNDTPYRY